MILRMRIFAACVVFIFCATAALADILEWQDANGVRHYTNLKSEVPKEHQPALQVVVDELARRPAAENAAASGEAAAETPSVELPRQAQVVYDRSEAAQAYVEGLERGLELARTMSAAGTGGNARFNGPLAIANAVNSSPYGGYLTPWYYPLVTTSFDRGRSRYLTLRMLLEDQFALDQEGPYVYQRYLPPFGYPALGVALSPFLPRGLPRGFPRKLRVITR
jgi:hypothetical protein